MVNGCWPIFAWPPVALPARALPAHAARARHLHSCGAPTDDDEVPLRGLTAWAFPVGDVLVGLTWEWVALRGGAVALGDPMTVISNLMLLDGRREPFAPARRLLVLHGLIYGLPWQQELPARPAR